MRRCITEITTYRLDLATAAEEDMAGLDHTAAPISINFFSNSLRLCFGRFVGMAKIKILAFVDFVLTY